MSEEPQQTSSRIAAIARAAALSAAVLAVAGPLVNQVGAAPMMGFGLFAVGAVLGGLLSLLLGLISIIVTRGGDDPVGRGMALQALAIGVLLTGAVLVGGSGGNGLPRINDITTDLEDPPALVAAAKEAPNEGRDMSYPPSFVPQVRAAYPDLAPIAVDAPAPEAFQRAQAAAEALGWEVVATNPAAGTLEARDTTAIFRFVDDISVRVRPRGGAAIVDIRSKSRDGQGDLGANANRIRAFAAELGAGDAS